MTWIQVAEHLDDVVFEQALIDSIYDMCFIEGEDTIKTVEDYLNAIEQGENTADQDHAILDRTIPYFENTFSIYGRYLTEGEVKSGGVNFVTGASAMKAKQASGVVPADKSGIHSDGQKIIGEGEIKADTDLKKTGADAKSAIDSNDAGTFTNIIMKGEGDYYRGALEIGSAKAKTALEKGGPALAQTHQAGIINKMKSAELVAKKAPTKKDTSLVTA